MVATNFCTYEQALALKELGFNWDTDYVYMSVNSNISLIHKHEFNGAAFNKICDSSYPAPTLYEAQKWLMKEKNVVVISLPNGEYYDENDWRLTGTWDYELYIDSKDMTYGPEHNFEDSEEALSAGITEYIKLLAK